MTNREYINSLPDDEFLAIFGDKVCDQIEKCPSAHGLKITCEQCKMNWLKSERVKKMIKMHKGIYYNAYYNYDDNGEKEKALEEIHGYIIQYDNVQYGAVWTGKEWHLTDIATGNRLTTVYPFKTKKHLFYFIERESESLKKHHAHNHKEIEIFNDLLSDFFNDLLSDLLKKEHAE